MNHNLANHLPHKHDISPNLLRALGRIWDCGNVEEIAEQTLTSIGGVGANPGFTLRGGFAIRTGKREFDINGVSVDVDRTVEFRYKESTGSASEDHHWLKLCLHIVRAAEFSQARFQYVLGGVSTAKTLENLLFSLHVGVDEVQWWLRIAERHLGLPGPLKKTRFLEPENI